MPLLISPSAIPKQDISGKLPAWPVDMRQMHRVTRNLMARTVKAMNRPVEEEPKIQDKPDGAQSPAPAAAPLDQHFLRAFGGKETPAGGFMAVGQFLMKLHEWQTRMEQTVEFAAPPSDMPLTPQEIEILRRFVERVSE